MAAEARGSPSLSPRGRVHSQHTGWPPPQLVLVSKAGPEIGTEAVQGAEEAGETTNALMQRRSHISSNTASKLCEALTPTVSPR
jgi:hypothetical protein